MNYRRWVQNAKRSFENYPSVLDTVKQAYRQPQVSLQDELKTRQGKTMLRHTMPLRDTQGEISGRIWVYRDVSDLVQARQVAEEAQAVAEEANQAKSQFLSRMSHEIRTPMHGVMGSLDLLQLDSLSPAQQQRLGQAQTSAEYLLEVIDEILDFSRLEAGQTTYQSRPFDLAQTCQQVLELLQPLAQQKGLRLQLEWTPDLAAARQGDQQKLRQVLINLLANAIKFSTEGSIRLKVQPLTAERLRLEVVDTGPGIPASNNRGCLRPLASWMKLIFGLRGAPV